MNRLRNSVQLIGHVGKQPEVRILESGNTLGRFSVATNETYLNSQGEKVTNTTWHSIVAWGKVAELCERLLKKGTEVVLDGKLVSRTYDTEDGTRKYITEIQLNEFVLVGNKASIKTEEPEPEEENELVFPEDK